MIFNPFPGLRSFEPNEEHLFFGRERQIDELVQRLRRTRFLAIVGTSGCGKSSLIRSGLLPSLYSGFMATAGSNWRVALFRPGGDPIGNLAQALDVLGDGRTTGEIERALTETTLRRSALGLVECVRQAQLPAKDNVLVIVDQFEELFRFKHARGTLEAREEAVGFAKLLLEAARNEAVPIYVALTMRSDFIGHCTEFPGLPEAVNDGQYLVPRMTRDELRLAITGPVAVGGAQIALRLTTRLLNDVGDDPDQLPVLQHALMRTWQYWEQQGASGPIDIEHYEAIGTMKRALSEHAEEAYAELGSDRLRRTAERVFKALTEPGDVASGGVRRPCRVDELAAVAAATPAEVIEVVDRFRAPGRSFLMPPSHTRLTDASIIDLSHESLMRVWSRLAEWVRQEARSAEIYRRLAPAARLHASGEVGLWRDPELQIALTWRDTARPTAAWGQRYDPDFEPALAFLAASERARDDAVAEQDRQRRRRLVVTRRVAAAMGVLAIAAVVLAVIAFGLRNEARAQAQAAEREARRAHEAAQRADQERARAELREREATVARSLAESETIKARLERERADRAATAARQAEEAARSSESLARKAEALARTAEVKERLAAADAQAAERTARDQAQAAIEARRQADAARDEATRAARETERLARLALARVLAGLAQRPWDEGTRDVGRLLARQAYLFHTANRGAEYDTDIYAGLTAALGQPPRFESHVDAVRVIALDAAGQRLASGSDDGVVRVFDAHEPGQAPLVLGGVDSSPVLPIRALAFDDSAQLLAVGAVDGPFRVWDVRHPAKPVFEGPPGQGTTSGVVFEGPRLVTAGFSGAATTGYASHIHIWSGEPLRLEQTVLEKHPQRITSLATSRATKSLAAATDSGVLLWQGAERQAGPTTLAAKRQMTSVAFSADGRYLAAGTREGQILTWDLTRGVAAPTTVSAHTAAVTALSYSSNGLLASASLDGTVKLIQPTGNAMPLATSSQWMWAVAFSPRGDRVFSGGADKRVQALITRADLLADQICRAVARNLDAEEWDTFVSAAEAYQPTCPNHVAGAAR